MFIDFRERGRERDTDVWEKHRSVCLLHMPWLGIEPVTFWCVGRCSSSPSHPARAYFLNLVGSFRSRSWNPNSTISQRTSRLFSWDGGAIWKHGNSVFFPPLPKSLILCKETRYTNPLNKKITGPHNSKQVVSNQCHRQYQTVFRETRA